MKKLKVVSLAGVSYISPLVGLGLLVFLKLKSSEKLFRNAVLAGMAVALVLYTLDFIAYIL